MKVLVTGSNGFIGSNTCKYLKKAGYSVVGLGRREESAVDGLDGYVQCDIATGNLEEAILKNNIDAVVHLAADMRQAPYETEVVYHNCVGTQRLLEACEAMNIKTFVQLSSLPVIGRPLEHPITEEHSIKPPTVYHVTKYSEELLANYAYYTHGVRTVSFRISAPVGIGVNPKTIFPTFVRNAVNGENLVLSGKGTRKQTYVHVDDIAQAIHRALISENAAGVYNLASYNLISNADLAKLCIEVLTSKSQIVYSGKDDPMDNDVWDVSIERLKSDTGYEPLVNLEYSIKELANFFEEQTK